MISFDFLLQKVFKRNALCLLKVLSVLGFCLGILRVWIWWLESRKLIGEKRKLRRCLQGSRGVRGIKGAHHSRLGELQLGRTFYQDPQRPLLSGCPSQGHAARLGVAVGGCCGAPSLGHAGRRRSSAPRRLSRWERLPRRAARLHVGGTWHAPDSSQARVRGDPTSRSQGAASYISHPARAGRTGAASLRVLGPPGTRARKREARPGSALV